MSVAAPQPEVAPDESFRSVLAAFAANALIALAKGVAAVFTGSPALLAETLHTPLWVVAWPARVVLLVYESEVGRNRARQLLGRTLKAEFELEYVNARRTNIRKVAEGSICPPGRPLENRFYQGIHAASITAFICGCLENILEPLVLILDRRLRLCGSGSICQMRT